MPQLSDNSKNLLVKKLSLVRRQGIDTSSLNQQFFIEFAYNQLAISGSNLKLGDAYKIACDLPTLINNSTISEFNNIRNALEITVSSAKQDQSLNQNLIDQVSNLLTGKAMPLMSSVNWLISYERLEHPVDLATLFIDKALKENPASEKIILILINQILIRSGLPLAIPLYNDRKRYQRLLKLLETGKSDDMSEFIAQMVLRSLEILLTSNNDSNCDKEHLSLQELSKYSPYSEAYLRKLALNGKLEAYKIGRNWLSSKAAIADYISRKQEISRI